MAAYTPGSSFSLSSLYNKSSQFSFLNSDKLTADFTAVLPSVSASFSASIATSADFSAELPEVSGLFSGFNPAKAVFYTPFNHFLLSTAYVPGAGASFIKAALDTNDLSATLESTAPFPSAEFTANYAKNQATFSATLNNCVAGFDAEYHFNVHRFALIEVASEHQSADRRAIETCQAQAQAVGYSLKIASQHQQASRLSIKAKSDLQSNTPLNNRVCVDYQQTALSTAKTCSLIDILSFNRTKLSALSSVLTSVFQRNKVIYDQLLFIDVDYFSTVDDSQQHIKQSTEKEPFNSVQFWGKSDFEIHHGYTPNNQFIAVNAPQTLAELAYIDYLNKPDQLQLTYRGIVSNKCTQLSWQTATANVALVCVMLDSARLPPPGISPWIDRPRPPIITPPDHQTIIIPTKETYLMQHSISATLLDDTVIHVNNINISLDADSFAYIFNCSLLDSAQLTLLEQVGNDPVTLVITVNSWVCHVLIEKINRGREFAKNTIKLSGRGISALLGAPYQPASSATQNSALTVQQIADLQLPLGWTIDWQMPTWLVPAGAYTHTNATPIQAIKQIAENIGAVVVPHPTQQILTLQPRYPVLPWEFDLTTEDVLIPDAVIPQLTERPMLPEQANGVYVHGAEIGGQIAFCRLNGTAGDKLTATVSNNLMTDPTALRALGERILAGQATQPLLESINLPMDGVDVPLLQIGQLLDINYQGSSIKGIVNSISLSASFSKVRQTIQLGEETTNTWTGFKSLLPADPLLLGTLSSTDGSTSLITLIDGGVIRVRGTGTVNSQYYSRAGKIDSPAPNMPQSEIVI